MTNQSNGRPTIAVVGATGQQGGATADALFDALSDDADLQAMFGWFAEPPAYQADFELTRDLDPGVWDFRTWLVNR